MSQNPLPTLAPGLVDPATMEGDAATHQAQSVLNTFNAALAADDCESLANCFFQSQAYWRDQLALTYHLRTFGSPDVIAASLLETKTLRSVKGEIAMDGAAMFLPLTPVLVSGLLAWNYCDQQEWIRSTDSCSNLSTAH